MESTNSIVRAWVDGWVVSRGASFPVVEDWGYTIDVGLPKQVTRYVFAGLGADVDTAAVRKVAAAVAAPGVWLKVFAPEEDVMRLLGPGWTIDEPGHLMSVALRRVGAAVTPGPAGTGLPDGYRLRSWTRGGVTRVLVTAPDGSFAARGQVAPTGATAVVDQVETSAEHRRRRLGSLVMRTLAEAALEQGAETGVLGATDDGRALYTSLGWRVQAPLTSVHYVPEEPTDPAARQSL
ncbi:GNAT family N-acetyltransferase [Streptomyces sp. NPDC002004]